VIELEEEKGCTFGQVLEARYEENVKLVSNEFEHLNGELGELRKGQKWVLRLLGSLMVGIILALVIALVGKL